MPDSGGYLYFCVYCCLLGGMAPNSLVRKGNFEYLHCEVPNLTKFILKVIPNRDCAAEIS